MNTQTPERERKRSPSAAVKIEPLHYSGNLQAMCACTALWARKIRCLLSISLIKGCRSAAITWMYREESKTSPKVTAHSSEEVSASCLAVSKASHFMTP